MSFSQRLEVSARLVETRLNDILGERSEASLVLSAPPRLIAAMRHAAIGGGKRFRPFLVLECAALFGLKPGDALDAAAALELIHCYSLAHDDLPAMDNDELRRAQPTVWKAYDDWTAILAGDALLTLAFELLARPQAHPDASVRADIIGTLAKAAGARGMVGGQALDLAAEKLGEPFAPSAADIHRMQSMKTGALIATACELGALLGCADAASRLALRAYGSAIGLAFQIADDLLDAEGDASVVGKAVAKDGRAGKATLVSLLGAEQARLELEAAERAALTALEPFAGRAAALREAAGFVVRRQS